MSWHHVEDTESKAGSMYAWQSEWTFGVQVPVRRHSSTTIALSTWRCGSCRALAVTKKGVRPDCKCGKCGAPP